MLSMLIHITDDTVLDSSTPLVRRALPGDL
jgi:hypothetical protein